MPRAMAIIALYVFAIVALYGATALAPHMTWPRTALELQAAAMLILGCIAKTFGAWLLLESGK